MRTLLDRIFIEEERALEELKSVQDFNSNIKDEKMNSELNELSNMTEEQACTFYNVGTKSEAEILIVEFYKNIA